MKDFWSVKILCSNRNTFHLALKVTAIFLLPIIIACSPESSTEHPIDAQTSIIKHSQRDAAQIENNIKNSYARLAAKRMDICPKLVQKNKGNNIINRASEVMVDDHCDYFLYLREGQLLDVDVNNSQIEALLIVPTLHNFADGDYQVESFDKHIVRLNYNGANHKPERLNYDVTIIVTD